MALQYALQHPEGEPLTIVPAGLTYFQGHKFRGRAVVDFGTPLHVPSQLVDEYAKVRSTRCIIGRAAASLAGVPKRVTQGIVCGSSGRLRKA